MDNLDGAAATTDPETRNLSWNTSGFVDSCFSNVFFFNRFLSCLEPARSES